MSGADTRTHEKWMHAIREVTASKANSTNLYAPFFRATRPRRTNHHRAEQANRSNEPGPRRRKPVAPNEANRSTDSAIPRTNRHVRLRTPDPMKMGAGGLSWTRSSAPGEAVLCLVPPARRTNLVPTSARLDRRTRPCRPRPRGEHAEQTAPRLEVAPAAASPPHGGDAHGHPSSTAAPGWTSTRRPSSPASAASAPTARSRQQVRTFGTMTADLLALADWLAAAGRHATSPWSRPASTGSRSSTSWRAGSSVMLVNAQHIKQVPGRKTDVKDAEWIAQLLQHGLLRAQLRPAAADPRAARPDAAADPAGRASGPRWPTGSRRCWRTPTSSWPASPPTCWASRAGP